MEGRDGKIKLLIVRHGETDCNVHGIIQGQLDTDLNAVGRRQAEHVGKALSLEKIDEVYTSPLRRAKDTADSIVKYHSNYPSKSLSSYWLDERLKERGFGSLEGKTFDRRKPKRDSIDGIEPMAGFISRLRSFLEDVLTRPAPFEQPMLEKDDDPEWTDVMTTTQASLADDVVMNGSFAQHGTQAAVNHHDRTILLVAHGAAISALVGSFLVDMNLATLGAGIPRTRIWNCSITEIIIDESQLPKKKKNRVDLQPLIESGSRSAFIIKRWADVRHLPKEIDDAVEGKGNVDEMVGRAAS